MKTTRRQRFNFKKRVRKLLRSLGYSRLDWMETNNYDYGEWTLYRHNDVETIVFMKVDRSTRVYVIPVSGVVYYEDFSLALDAISHTLCDPLEQLARV